MKKTALTLACLMAFLMVNTFAEEEKPVPLKDVPKHVIKAAKKAVPGIVLSEAEVEVEGGVKVYELEGVAGERSYEIEVDADGKVLEVEEAGKEDDEDEEDDDDDEEEGKDKDKDKDE